MSKNKYGSYKLFIGSSSEALPLLKILSSSIEEVSKNDNEGLELIPVPWNKYFSDEPIMNTTFLDIFPDILNECDFGLFILSQDDTLIKRNIVKKMTRDNVWFEAGMFMGKRGKEQTYFFINSQDYDNIHFPTDISGMTLQGAEWNTEIANLYFDDSVILTKNAEIQDKIKKKIKTQVDRYVNLLFRKIKIELNKKIKLNEAKILLGNEQCFNEGISLVEEAKSRLYTTVAFSQSLKNKTENERLMENALKKQIAEKKVDFQRYMKIDIAGIKTQYDNILSYIDSEGLKNEYPFLYECSFDYFELIISDDSVLIVLPDYTDPNQFRWERVSFGILIKNNRELAHIVSNWLLRKLCK